MSKIIQNEILTFAQKKGLGTKQVEKNNDIKNRKKETSEPEGN